MNKKEYMRPELFLKRFTLKDVILASVENHNEHGNGDELDPIISDPDDEIEW
ncbi:MAG: hypothetical protein II163_04585 [Ruminococcus sp.]|nr:hypothetical protein [uncultured Ruminococcus sp.]MBQ1898424.1 hypothetical protein [Ruminococcus sp.]MBQ4239465.1 hypothetical protein [Ruminococcus sp.]